MACREAAHTNAYTGLGCGMLYRLGQGGGVKVLGGKPPPELGRNNTVTALFAQIVERPHTTCWGYRGRGGGKGETYM